MAASSTRTITVVYAGAVVGTQPIAAASNAASPAQVDLVNLSAGANTITVPTGGATAVGVTIVPPAGNTSLITLKGIAGDTGVPLHKTDPTSIALDATCATFVLNAAAPITGVRFFWT